MNIKIIFGTLTIFSLAGIIFLSFVKSNTHLKYRRFKRGERYRGLFLNQFYMTPYILQDYFSATFLFFAFGKNKNEELESMRRRINWMVIAIYFCIIILVATLLISTQILKYDTF